MFCDDEVLKMGILKWQFFSRNYPERLITNDEEKLSIEFNFKSVTVSIIGDAWKLFDFQQKPIEQPHVSFRSIRQVYD